MKLDERTEQVVEMYSKYPFPSWGNHGDYFERFVLPAIVKLRSDYPIRRLLEAGCGTGNLTTDIATRLPDVQITAVDLTEESLGLARQRAAQQGLKNVTFQKSNLLEHDTGLGLFDFVYCQGVIHHLTDPLAGMKNLNRYLEQGHHAFVWLYSFLGRRRILELREALKILGVESLPWEAKVALAQAARPHFLSQRRTLLRKVITVLEYCDKHGFKGLGRFLTDRLKQPSGEAAGRIVLADRDLHPQDNHPQDKFYRFAEALELFHQAGFELASVLQGMSNTLQESFGDDVTLVRGRNFSQREAYTLIELHEQPEGVGYLIQKNSEV